VRLFEGLLGQDIRLYVQGSFPPIGEGVDNGDRPLASRVGLWFGLRGGDLGRDLLGVDGQTFALPDARQ